MLAFTAALPENPYLKEQSSLRLMPIRDGARVVLGRDERRAVPKGGGTAHLASVGEFAHWRSPRGLDFRVEGGTIRLRAYDGSGAASFRRKDGAVTGASGTLAALRGKKLVRVKRDGTRGFFLTDACEDYLVDVRWLRGYLAGRSEPLVGGGLRLAIPRWEAEPIAYVRDPRARALPPNDRYRAWMYHGWVDTNSDGLGISVPEWTMDEEAARGRTVLRTTRLLVTFANTGRRSRAIQPFRLGLADGRSLPCMMVTHPIFEPGSPEIYGEVGAYDAVNSPANVRIPDPFGQSFLLKPGRSLSMVLTGGRTPPPKNGLEGRPQRLRYADGEADLVFKVTGREMEIGR